ncbi:MAG: [FeFe] hydrogenase H-cluster maturation GTPase HydF [Lachnospiraceae bacterium]|nr:[FeFe] hydrogenase H-cluster maturation GTPase HydF [Lachnospiraceae bacterium]
MGLNDTPSANRLHISFFGKRNAGKSSVMNAVTGQDLAVVSDYAGTTTDPVYKSMELLPLGPVMMIDTPGFDDVGELGAKRVGKTMQVLNKTDIAVLVVDANAGIEKEEEIFLDKIKFKEIPCVVVFNKMDEAADILSKQQKHPALAGLSVISVSAKTGENIHALKEIIAACYQESANQIHLVSDFVSRGDYVIMVIPIDAAAPKGRLILPQQQAIRDCLEAGAYSIAVKETELKDVLESLPVKPKLVITDSQAFQRVSAETPEDILLTSFSILMARYKGVLDQSIEGVRAIRNLKDGDVVLISEGCTHHRQCGDIGTVKIPGWIRQFTDGKEIRIETTSGTEFPEDLSKYACIIHCGGCMLNEREMLSRMRRAKDEGIPFTNYGIAIAYMTGILERSIEVIYKNR